MELKGDENGEAVRIRSGQIAGKQIRRADKRAYPIEDAAHAKNAKARAGQAVKAGRMSEAEESKIDRKADAVIRKD